MGLAHSRIIYDPENRNLDLQDFAKQHYTRISDWKIDEKGRMVCTESIDILPGIRDYRFEELYAKLDKLGLKGVYPNEDHHGEKANTVYSFKEIW